MPGPLTVAEVTAPYGNFMRNPAGSGDGVCDRCWTFVSPAYELCYQCAGHGQGFLDVVVPVTYSVGGEQMHLTLRHYKDHYSADHRALLTRDLGAILWRFLHEHEGCIAEAAGIDGFDVVTTVPSKTLARDEQRKRLRTIVGQLCGATASRFEQVIHPTDQGHTERRIDCGRFAAHGVAGSDVLLVDDTWTTGASSQSAAYALRQAGAASVSLIVIGRHVNRDYQDNDRRLTALAPAFSWDTCAVH